MEDPIGQYLASGLLALLMVTSVSSAFSTMRQRAVEIDAILGTSQLATIISHGLTIGDPVSRVIKDIEYVGAAPAFDRGPRYQYRIQTGNCSLDAYVSYNDLKTNPGYSGADRVIVSLDNSFNCSSKK